jgi:hypothetical protein
MDFHRAWKSTAKEALLQRYKIIWKSYHIHRMNDIPLNATLQQSATHTVRPYFQSKDPDFILATDIEYEEKEFFKNSDLGTTPIDASEWTEVSSKKHKKKSPNTSPSTSPAASPTPALDDVTLDAMEISDEALMSLSLARTTPMPDAAPPIIDTPPAAPSDLARGCHTPDTIPNPYSKPRKLSYRTNNSNRLHPTAPSQSPSPANHSTPTPIELTDLTDDVATQSTSATNDTFRPHQGNVSPNASTRASAPRNSNDKVPINDGTLRITIRWKPSNYAELTTDDNLRHHQATLMLQDILHHPLSPISLVPWTNAIANNTTMTTTTSLTPTSLPTLCSPKTSNLSSLSMFVFGIRICATDPTFSTGVWLTDDIVKKSLDKHQVALTVSNSTCDSGRMVTAGSILLKHPQYTHRLHFLRALRSQLPINTPFFDIGIHRHTLNGIHSPHLVVKCGENHQETLTEILSAFLDGQQTTAIYIGTKVLQSMMQEATKDLFDTHQKYVNAIQRLPLHPHIVNIDRPRDEGPNTYNRSTRAWANSLQSLEGKSFQCDAENGGTDKRAYLLVPAHLVSLVQPILHQYQYQLRSNRQILSTTNNQQDRPDEIYVPTATVQRNVDFLRTMSASAIWKMRRLQSVTPHILQHRYQETCKIIPKTPHTHQQPEQETPRKPHLHCIRPFAMEIQQQQLQLNNTADPRKPDHTANPTTVNTSNHSHVPLTIIPPQRFIPLQAPPSTPATTPQPASPSSRLPSNQINMTLNS